MYGQDGPGNDDWSTLDVLGSFRTLPRVKVSHTSLKNEN